MSTLSYFLEKSTALHHHLCPRQVLGVRMGFLAGKLLGIEVPQVKKRLFIFMETDGCCADGVSVVTNCWIGRRTMRIVDFGKIAATFVDTQSKDAFRVHPHRSSRQAARELCPSARSRWHAQLEAYQILDDEELFVVTPVKLRVDLEALISRPGVRAQCENCQEEIINQREQIHDGMLLCCACAGESYYQPAISSFFEDPALRFPQPANA